MKKILLVPASVVCSFIAFSQSPATTQATKAQSAAVSTEQTFEQYCLEHALQVITVTGKDVQTAGELTQKGPKASYRDYGITLKESEAQYFTIAGSTQLMKVESLFRLRLSYTNKH